MNIYFFWGGIIVILICIVIAFKAKSGSIELNPMDGLWLMIFLNAGIISVFFSVYTM